MNTSMLKTYRQAIVEASLREIGKIHEELEKDVFRGQNTYDRGAISWEDLKALESQLNADADHKIEQVRETRRFALIALGDEVEARREQR